MILHFDIWDFVFLELVLINFLGVTLLTKNIDLLAQKIGALVYKSKKKIRQELILYN